MLPKEREKERKPIIGIIADTHRLDSKRYVSVGQKYIEGLTAVTDLIPFILPTNNLAQMDGILEHIDGLMLTGSPSNVHPSRYHVAPRTQELEQFEPFEPFDTARDESVFAYIPACLERKIPILGICRGFQEFNVALGGTLIPAVHELDGKFDHREPDTTDRDIKHAPRHGVTFPKGGLFESWTGMASIQVNSLHRQAVDKLAAPLHIEATADDGTIEGVALKDADSFGVAVQWHPEYKSAENIFSKEFFRAFERAVNGRANNKANT